MHSGVISVESDRVIDYDTDDLDAMTPLYIDETDDEIFLYYEHPRNFIPPSVLEWYEEYSYYKEFSVAPNFADCNLKFLDAKAIYDHFTNYWNTPKANNEGYS